MITVHHLENSRSHRIIWLLEELKLDYEIVHYQRNKKTMLAPASLKQAHPLGKSPVIIDSTDNTTTVAETGAIIEYLMDQYDDGTLRPKSGTVERQHYNFWLHYTEGSLMPVLLLRLLFNKLNKSPMPLPLRPVAGLIATGVRHKFIQPRLKEHMEFMENEIAKRKWFCGKRFSAADIMLSMALQGLAARNSLADYPNLSNTLEKMLKRPAYRRAIKRGGELELLT